LLIASVQNIEKSYAGQTVLDGVSFTVSTGERLGLIGPNGCGKTTLLDILLGREQADSGAAYVSSGVRVGYVPQYVEYDDETSVLGHLLKQYHVCAETLRLEEERLAASSEADRHRAMLAYQKAREDYERIDGDSLEHRAVAMLDALGLGSRSDERVGTLSGGEKNVLSLAQALLARPDFLILDEPANHLDYLGIAWLEDFLSRFKGAILIVSHNRYLLDRVVTGILAFESRRIRYYGGNYSDYQTTRLTELLAQQADYAANQKKLARLEALVNKFESLARAHPDPAWGKRLRARRHQLEREKAQAVEKPDPGPDSMKPDFTGRSTKANIALQLRGYSKAFGETALFENAEMDISCGERVALIGPNGCGKTTLLRDIVANGSWTNSKMRIGPSLTVGFCAQEQEVLTSRRSLFDEICATISLTNNEALSLLARFLFTGEDVKKKVEDLSGGERNRLQLAKLMILQPNFLILDEPTNHLDIMAREAVEEALGEYKGTLLVVSHDRYFLDKIATRVVEVVGRRLISYPGNFSDFWFKRQAALPRIVGRASQRAKVRSAEAAPPSQSAPRRKRTNPIVLANLEKRIAECERQKSSLESRMTASFARRDIREGHAAAKELDKLKTELKELYEKWVEAEE